MDGESEGLRRQVARLELTIQAEVEKGKVLQVSIIPSQPATSLCSDQTLTLHDLTGKVNV